MVRIEDLDVPRCPKENADRILHTLDWLGLHWDGSVWWQSQRSAVYAELLARPAVAERLYPCFCSRASLHAERAPHLADGTVVYAGTCRNLTKTERAARAQTRLPAMRIRVPNETVTFTDIVCGLQHQYLPDECGDFIVRRSDGVFAYQLAVVADDALSGVTEVVRGADLLGVTPRQIWLHRLLGFTPPAYAHIPLVCDASGRRLSKREGDAVVPCGSPQAALGRLAYAAGLRPDTQPVTLEELTESFSWAFLRRGNLAE